MLPTLTGFKNALERIGPILDWVVRCFVIVGAVTSLYLYDRQEAADQREREFSRCQANFNEITNARSRLLIEVAADERAAERGYDNSWIGLLADPAVLIPVEDRSAVDAKRLRDKASALVAAAATFKTEQAKADKTRSENPLPESPLETCGSLKD